MNKFEDLYDSSEKRGRFDKLDKYESFDKNDKTGPERDLDDTVRKLLADELI